MTNRTTNGMANGVTNRTPNVGTEGGGLFERVAEGVYRTRSAQGTSLLGELLGRVAEEGDAVVLAGDLGAGKTCFTGGVARGLGDASNVSSPTFNIMCVHDGGRIPLYHFDLYRLDDSSQLEDTGVFDALEGDGLCVVEWGDLFADELGDDLLTVGITRGEAGDGAPAGPGSEPARTLRLRGSGERSGALLGRFEAEAARPQVARA